MCAYKNILVMQTAFAGDLILTTALLRQVKNAFPKSRLTVLVIPQNAGILVNNPYVDEIITFSKRGNKVTAFIKTWWRIKKRHFDLVLLPHRSHTSALLVFLAGIKRRVGFNKRASWLYTDVVPVQRELHHRRRYLTLLPPLGITPDEDDSTQIFYTPKQSNQAAELLPPRQQFKQVVALSPGSVWPTKRWPAGYWAHLAGLLRKHGYGVFMNGSLGERMLCQKIIEQSGYSDIPNLAGSFDFTGAAAAIAQADLLVANDSGALHIANAVDTPVCAIFGPTVPSFGFYPYRKRDKVLEMTLECRPCGSHGHKRCPLRHHKCMTELLPQNVWEYVQEFFANS